MVRITKRTRPTPLRYEEVAEELRHQIGAAKFKPGDRLPSYRALRQQHGVTQATVDRVYGLLENEGLITRSERSGIFVARRGERLTTGIIGFCNVGFAKSYSTPFWIDLIESVEATAHEFNIQVLLLKAGVASGWEKVDGVLFNGSTDKVPANRLPPDLPAVSLFLPPSYTGSAKQRQQALIQTSLVTTDDYQAMHGATKHLLSLGHRRIAYLNNGQSDRRLYPLRLSGYIDALRDAGIKPDSRWLRALGRPTPKLYFMSAGREAMKQWLEANWNELGCTALLAQNDDTAWGAIEALRDAGMRVPDDVSVIGFDGTQSAAFCNPPLTTVEVPLQQMGRAAVEMLLLHVRTPQRPAETLTLPTRLRIRASTSSPR